MNRQARKFIFEQLFMCQFYQDNEVDGQLNNLLNNQDLLEEMHSDKLPEETRQQLKEKAALVFSRHQELDEIIDREAVGWKTHRMGRAELSLIRLALYEMLYDDEIPYRVSINEAVEIAKSYGGQDAPGFVNAVLGKIARAIGVADE